jgi:hypothetical protein
MQKGSHTRINAVEGVEDWLSHITLACLLQMSHDGHLDT